MQNTASLLPASQFPPGVTRAGGRLPPERGKVSDACPTFAFAHPLHPEIVEVTIQDSCPFHRQRWGTVIFLFPYSLPARWIDPGILQRLGQGPAEWPHSVELPTFQPQAEFVGEGRVQTRPNKVIRHNSPPSGMCTVFTVSSSTKPPRSSSKPTQGPSYSQGLARRMSPSSPPVYSFGRIMPLEGWM